jgi:pimeloyl-ACP methyl ester carboxylesterase
MAEQRATANGIQIVYETIGDPSNPALVLVMGLGTQLIHWDRELCELFAERGFHVIRFDNRDAGRSTRIDAPVPNLTRAMAGLKIEAPYLLDDMADDAFGLLDHLGIEAAHVAGVSMGGMIAQTMAIRRPERVLSLTSIMSTTGERRAGRPKLRVWGVSATLGNLNEARAALMPSYELCITFAGLRVSPFRLKGLDAPLLILMSHFGRHAAERADSDRR